MSILLQRSLSQTDIDHAKSLCLLWRELFVALTSEADGNFINFHAVLHMFDHISRWGPPILWWARPFEAKHRTFRQYISHSNYHNLELWTAKKEMIMQSFRYLYPQFRWKAQVQRQHKCSVKPDSCIMFHFCGTKTYGRVMSISEDKTLITLRPLLCVTQGKKHKIIGAPQFNDTDLGPAITIPYCDYLGHTLVTNGYINDFVCLQLIKK
jgi:hypothetical protein